MNGVWDEGDSYIALHLAEHSSPDYSPELYLVPWVGKGAHWSARAYNRVGLLAVGSGVPATMPPQRALLDDDVRLYFAPGGKRLPPNVCRNAELARDRAIAWLQGEIARGAYAEVSK